jgi:ClpP class serine protease
MSQYEQLTRKRSNAMHSKQQQLEKAERAWYRAKARAEQAVDRLSDCERKIARLREELNYAELPGRTPPGSHGAVEVRGTSRITANDVPGPKSQNPEKVGNTGAASIARRQFKILFTKREHATILAALRLWQEADEHNRGDLRDIAEAAGVPLSNQEIDVLCDRINFTSNREA